MGSPMNLAVTGYDGIVNISFPPPRPKLFTITDWPSEKTIEVVETAKPTVEAEKKPITTMAEYDQLQKEKRARMYAQNTYDHQSPWYARLREPVDWTNLTRNNEGVCRLKHCRSRVSGNGAYARQAIEAHVKKHQEQQDAMDAEWVAVDPSRSRQPKPVFKTSVVSRNTKAEKKAAPPTPNDESDVEDCHKCPRLQ